MSNQTIFKRYEFKYLLTMQQKEKVLEAMQAYMELDQYGHTTIRNIYFDTDNYRLIRHSIEKPAYKEKLRIRSYRKAKPDTEVFVELKKKYDHVVYKRRIPMMESKAVDWVCNGKEREALKSQVKSQIAEEIDYFISYYETLKPTVFLSYERDAYFAKDGSDFRVTFDENIFCRQSELSLQADVWGETVLDEDKTLMEIKCSGAIPVWMTQVLSEERIFRTSFSKYGTAYQRMIYPQMWK